MDTAHLILRMAPGWMMMLWAVVFAIEPNNTAINAMFMVLVGISWLVSGVEVHTWRECMRRYGEWRR